MTKETATKASAFRRTVRSRWFLFAAAAVIFVCLTLILLPYAIEYQGERWLESQGVDKTEIENIDFNPFTGRFVAENLRATVGDSQVLHVQKVTAQVDWLPLPKRRARLKKLTLQDTEVTIEHLGDEGWRVGGLVLAVAKEVTDETDKPGWGFAVAELEIYNSRVRQIGYGLDITMQIDRAEMTRLETWQAEQAAHFKFQGKVMDADLNIEADIFPFASEPRVDGRIELHGFSLKPFQQLLAPHVAELEGELHIDGKLDARHQGTSGQDLRHQGTISLHRLQVGGERFKVKEEKLEWEGNIRAALVAGQANLKVALEGKLASAGLALDLPPEKLSVQHGGMSWQGKLDAQQEGEGGLSLNQQGLFTVEQAQLAGEGFKVSEEKLEWEGSAQAALVAGQANSKVTLEGKLASAGLTLNLAAEKLSVQHGGMSWQGKLDAQQEGEGGLSLNQQGLFTVEQAQLAGEGFKVSEEKLEWEGSAQAALVAGQANSKVTLEGKLASAGLTLNLAAEKLSVQHGGMSWQGKLDAQQEGEGGLSLNQQGLFTVEQAQLASELGELSQKRLTWEGGVNFVKPGASGSAKLTSQGRLEAGELTAAMTGEGLRLQNAGLTWEGQFDFGKEEASTALALSGNFKMGDFQVDDPGRGLRLLQFESFNLQEISAQNIENVEVAQAELGRLHFLQYLHNKGTGGAASEVPLLKLGRATFKEISLRDLRNLAVDSVGLVDVVSVLKRDAKGRWRLIADLATDRGEGPQAAEAKAEPRALPGLRLGRLKISGESGVRLEDASVEPPYRLALQLSDFLLEDLDSSKPEQASALSLVSKIDEYTSVSFQGEVRPFSQGPGFDLTGKIDELNLPPLSPYVVRQIGYILQSGHLDSDIALKSTGGKLEGSSKLFIKNLEVAPYQSTEQQEFDRNLKVPLNSALSMLRDSDGNIELEIPITGDINDPNFDYTDAINQALIKGMSAAALGYFAYALQPYGAILGVVQLARKAGKVTTAVRLNPLSFAAGSAELQGDALPYLERVAGLMKKRPELKVKLCGKVTESDRTALGGTADAAVQAEESEQPPSKGKGAESTQAKPQAQPAPPAVTDEQLLGLARQRSEAAMRHLVKQHGIPAERLYLCYPEIDRGAAAEPRVDLLV